MSLDGDPQFERLLDDNHRLREERDKLREQLYNSNKECKRLIKDRSQLDADLWDELNKNNSLEKNNKNLSEALSDLQMKYDGLADLHKEFVQRHNELIEKLEQFPRWNEPYVVRPKFIKIGNGEIYIPTDSLSYIKKPSIPLQENEYIVVLLDGKEISISAEEVERITDIKTGE